MATAIEARIGPPNHLHVTGLFPDERDGAHAAIILIGPETEVWV